MRMCLRCRSLLSWLVGRSCFLTMLYLTKYASCSASHATDLLFCTHFELHTIALLKQDHRVDERCCLPMQKLKLRYSLVFFCKCPCAFVSNCLFEASALCGYIETLYDRPAQSTSNCGAANPKHTGCTVALAEAFRSALEYVIAAAGAVCAA